MNAYNEKILIDFSVKHIRLIWFLFIFFLLAVLFRIHGYSLPEWREYIDGSAKKEILLGDSRGIRSDDWAVEIPLMLAQLHHKSNNYPLLNENIGNGLNMFVHSKVPIKHILTFFRPSVWGFFLGGDYGLAWMWWVMVLGLFYAYFLVFMLISENNFEISFLGGVFLVFSPFFQFWSFHMAEIPIFMALIFVSFFYICFCNNKRTILVHAVLLGFFMGCFALNFVYPPYQISCAYLLLFLMIGFFADRFSSYDIRKYLFFRISALNIGVTIFLFAIIYYFITIAPAMHTMMETVYPGSRFCVGGDHQIWLLFRNNFLLPTYALFNLDWSQTPVGNICESSSFFFLFLPVGAIIILDFLYWRKNKDLFSFILLCYLALMLIYIFIGINPILSKYSLFYMMQSQRSIIGLGVANVVLLVAFISKPYQIKRIERLLITLCWFILIFYLGNEFNKNFTQIPFRNIFFVSLLNGLICFLMLSSQKKKIFSIIVVFTFFSTFWFNPMVIGGTKFIYENELSKKIIEIDNEQNGQTVWLTYGSWVLGNLPRILGVKSINGTHPYPQFALWERLDPESKYKKEYNRYGHVTFTTSESEADQILSKTDNGLGSENSGVKFFSPSPDQFSVIAKPSSEILKKLGVTHVLATENLEEFDGGNLEKIFSYSNKFIYRVK